jgi:hypothetical protein
MDEGVVNKTRFYQINGHLGAEIHNRNLCWYIEMPKFHPEWKEAEETIFGHCVVVFHTVSYIAFISQKFKHRMSLIQKLKFPPVIKRKQNTYVDMNCIPKLYSNTCTSISCGYHTWSKFHFFGDPQPGLWWETGHIQKIIVSVTLFTLTQQNQPE